jgi:tripartite-type tricarboxylate transporter receptor subunit TctC
MIDANRPQSRRSVREGLMAIRLATRRRFLTAVAGAGAAVGLPAIGPVAAQQKYPTKPILMIVPFPPGGPIDTMARMTAQELGSRVGQVVVENRPGGGSTIGTKDAAAAAPDGYTLMFGSSGSLAVAPALYSSLKLDPRTAFVPIATVALLPHIFVVNNDVPAKSIGEFVAYAKANPGKSTLFKTEAKIDVVYVPYTGSAQSINDLLGGQTQFTIDGLVTLFPLIKAGKLRALALARGERWPALPDVPTLAESGYPDFVVDAWTGLVAPAGTPRPIVDQLNAAINDGLKSQAAQDNLAKFSAIAKLGTPEDFKNFLAEQTQKWASIVKLADARID